MEQIRACGADRLEQRPAFKGEGILRRTSRGAVCCRQEHDEQRSWNVESHLEGSLDRATLYRQLGNEVSEMRETAFQGFRRALRRLPWSLAVITLLVTATHGGASMLIQLHLESLSANPLTIGLASTLSFLGTAVGSVFWGLISSHFVIERLILWILGLSQVFAGLLALLLNPPGTLAVAFCYALCSSGLFPIILASVSKGTPQLQRGGGLSVITASRELGMALGTISAGVLLASTDMRMAFLVLAGTPLLCVFALIRLSGGLQDREMRHSAQQPGSASRGSLGMMYLGAAFRWFGTAGSFSFIYVYMHSLNLSRSAMGGISALGPFVAMAAMLCLGILSDRVGRRVIFVSGFGLSVLVPVLFGVATSAGGMVLAFVVSGTSIGALYVGATGYIADRTNSRKHGVMLGLFEASRALGGILGPVVAGAIVPHVGLRGMFWVMSIATGIGFLSVSTLREARKIQ